VSLPYPSPRSMRLTSRIPIPVNLKRKDLKAELARAVSSTYYNPTTGTSVSVRVATPSTSTPAQAIENLLEAIPQVVAQIQDEWENILSIGIKTSNSVFLPVYSAKLDGRFDGSTKKDSKSDVEMEESPAPVSAPVPAKKEAVKQKTKSVAAEAAGKEKKKSSTIGSGSVAKKSKQGVLGKEGKAGKAGKAKA
jgi:ribosome biogenesis protein UTP30